MRNFITLGIAALLATGAFVGCSSDNGTQPTQLNPFFELKQGDTFTYARYERDMNNQRVESSKTMHKWAVLQTDLSFAGQSKVARILQINYDGSMSTEISPRDTIYIRSAIDGKIWIYNMIGTAIARVPSAAPFASSVPAGWFQAGDNKNAGALSWSSTGGLIIAYDTVDVPPLTVPLKLEISGTAYHKGKVPTSVGSTTYANAFHTDHTITVKATGTVGGFPITAMDDSLALSFDTDITSGIIRQVMKSDTVVTNLTGTPSPTPVPGFEMELVGMVRK